MRSIVVLTAVAVAAAWVVVTHLPEGEAAATTHATRSQEVQSVALDGRKLPMAALRETLATHAGDLLDRSKLDHDRGALEAALVGRGYLSAAVQPAQVMFDATGGAFVTFAITEGPLFHVRSIQVVGATERDAGIVTIAKGDVVRSDQLAHARDALAERLVVRGKQSQVVVVELAPDEATAAVDVVLAAR